ncbi:hypothetical protein [Chondromyces apiculatus]|uniref:Uncharacterized protein n=1 Tax=Chondromyces apiculatus DSM 436 TaxID=1192034 RepID=A0A017T7R9_9BACT|nr:hypothetical protein [Chondromyces apiculatus]EYF04855.1 Hypothetical protein CAP_3881 [Chondromyces apiculatus DSM 436]
MGRMRRIGLLLVAACSLAVLGCSGSQVAGSGGTTPKSAAEGPSGSEAGGSRDGDVGNGASGEAKAPEAPAPAEPGGADDGLGSASAGPATQGAAGGRAVRPTQPAPAPPPASTPARTDGAGRLSKKESAPPGDEVAATQPPRARPGLGTEWGETRTSRITTAPFVRADPTSPFALVSLSYNDEQGARAMAGLTGFQRTAAQAFTVASGAVQLGLRGEAGQFLSGFTAEGNRFVVGEHGMRYSIVLRNLTSERFECVVSVDGLDVIDGQAAAFPKRGYLLEPNGELVIDGFRQSADEVAAFRFGSVRGSYAGKKHGDTRNVGVIGVALFHERGATLWTPEEIRRRQNANPFPGQFATPPGVP